MNPESLKQEIGSAVDLKELDAIYKKYLGRKGEISLALRELKNMPESERKENARNLQALKGEVEGGVLRRAGELGAVESENVLSGEWLDVTAPGQKAERGHLHPLTQIQNKANEIFTSLGFEIVEGPEVETEWYNFDALNIPKDHPARDMWDTFWLKGDKKLLRTHTSPVQIRYMEQHQPPFRIIAPGRTFRHEASDASHDIQFYQLEGLMVDKDISVANFKAVINEFLSRLFGKNVKIRLRPSFFPFVEPGFEVDMYGPKGWMEMLGAGMVHQNVFKAAGYNPGEWQGFAFGIGLDRIAMMKYKIDDIRLFYSGDLRFLKQF
jgi:phenylalanyl-tRNA synthetase alpha chain